MKEQNQLNKSNNQKHNRRKLFWVDLLVSQENSKRTNKNSERKVTKYIIKKNMFPIYQQKSRQYKMEDGGLLIATINIKYLGM